MSASSLPGPGPAGWPRPTRSTVRARTSPSGARAGGRRHLAGQPSRGGVGGRGPDYAPAAIKAAAGKNRGVDGLSYVVGDLTRLPSAHLGTFDFFLDIGCFQGLDAEQRLSQGEVFLRLPTRGPHCCCSASARAGGGGWPEAHRGRRSRPPSRAGRCSRSSRQTPRAWAGRRTRPRRGGTGCADGPSSETGKVARFGRQPHCA